MKASQVLFMLLRLSAGYENIVHVHKDAGNATADLIHKALKCLDHIAKSVGHPHIPKKSNTQPVMQVTQAD